MELTEDYLKQQIKEQEEKIVRAKTLYTRADFSTGYQLGSYYGKLNYFRNELQKLIKGK